MFVCMYVCLSVYKGFKKNMNPKLTRHDHLLALRQHDPACRIPCIGEHVCVSMFMFVCMYVCLTVYQGFKRYTCMTQLTRHDHLLALRHHNPACRIPCRREHICVSMFVCMYVCLQVYHGFKRNTNPNSPGMTISLPSGSTILPAASHV